MNEHVNYNKLQSGIWSSIFRLFNAYIRSVLLHEVETWTLTKDLVVKPQGFIHKGHPIYLLWTPCLHFGLILPSPPLCRRPHQRRTDYKTPAVWQYGLTYR